MSEHPAADLPTRVIHLGLILFGLSAWLTGDLADFAWMAPSGTVLYFGAAPGVEPEGWVHVFEEGHEVGEVLIPAYLFLHVGAVLVHALLGHTEVWRRMFGRQGVDLVQTPGTR